MSIEEKNIDGEKEVYYVIYKEPKDNSFKREIGIAKLDQGTKCFYDYFYRPGNLNYDELEVGQKVTIDEWKNIVLIDKSINEEVLRIIKKNEMLSEELEKKYGERGAYDHNGYLPSTEDIIFEFAKDRFNNNKPLDFYIIAILRVLCPEMGLKVSNNSFSYLAFSYPESVYEIISAMYDIIDENLSEGKTREFQLYINRRVNEEYKQFLREIERRTRFRMPRVGSKLLEDIKYEAYINGENSKKWKELSAMIPTFIISPNSFAYYTNKAKKNAPVIKSTRKKAEENRDFYLLRFDYFKKYDNESEYSPPRAKR